MVSISTFHTSVFGSSIHNSINNSWRFISLSHYTKTNKYVFIHQQYLSDLCCLGGICTQSFKRTTQSQIVYDANSQHVAVGNFNRDNLLDLVIANSGIDNIGVRLATGNDSSTVFIACYDPLYSIININLFTRTTSKDPGSLFSSSWNRYRYKSYTAAGCWNSGAILPAVITLIQNFTQFL